LIPESGQSKFWGAVPTGRDPIRGDLSPSTPSQGTTHSVALSAARAPHPHFPSRKQRSAKY